MNDLDRYAESICKAFDDINGYHRELTIDDYIKIRACAADELRKGFASENISVKQEPQAQLQTRETKEIKETSTFKKPNVQTISKKEPEPARLETQTKPIAKEKPSNTFELLKAIPDNWN